MFRNRGKQNRSTQRNFLLGERSLRAYLAGGNVRFLEDAEANLSMIGPDAKQYKNARFYLGITKAQLRKADESIDILEKLQKRVSSERKRGLEVDFADRISLQLAYAHIKKYTDEEFEAAEKILDGLVLSASSKDSVDLALQAKSLQAFLYSVMAGNSKLELQRSEFARKALTIGHEVLKDPGSTPAVRFEAFNALGIAWMRLAHSEDRVASADGTAGEGSQTPDRTSTLKKGSEGDAAESWKKAEDSFEQALTIIPNSVRVLQNMATLRLEQVKQGIAKDPSVLLAEAKQLVKRSLEVNDQDQFPFYQLARIAVAEKDKASALEYIREGRGRPGAVKEKSWETVKSAAEALQT
jgi:tetratricopeptide (TPR) repeat protein